MIASIEAYPVTILFNAEEQTLLTGAATVGTIRQDVKALMNIPNRAFPRLNGEFVQETAVVGPEEILEFIVPWGSKGGGQTNTGQREEFGLTRTRCACKQCKVWCQHQPGYLVPSDLDRLIPPGQDPFAWAEVHLRASPGLQGLENGKPFTIPSLVPAKQENGHCHWFQDGLCAVHGNSPFGCAFLDQHMNDAEADRRNKCGRMARVEAFAQHHLYEEIWNHLWHKGLVYLSSPTDRAVAFARIKKIGDRAKQKCRREDAKNKRKSKKQQQRRNKHR